MIFAGPVDPDLLRTQGTIECALALLDHLAKAPDSTGSFNMANILGGAKRAWGSERDLAELLESLVDAWTWLESQGLIGPDYKQMSTSGWRRITGQGKQVADSSSVTAVIAENHLAMRLHRLLEGSVRPSFVRGDFEIAAFAAMKAVEVRVRELADAEPGKIGVALMTYAFKPDGGVLVDDSMEQGEKVARMNLFSGAIGSFKNPASHRPIDFADPIEAAEVVLLADLLLRMLDRLNR